MLGGCLGPSRQAVDCGAGCADHLTHARPAHTQATCAWCARSTPSSSACRSASPGRRCAGACSSRRSIGATMCVCMRSIRIDSPRPHIHTTPLLNPAPQQQLLIRSGGAPLLLRLRPRRRGRLRRAARRAGYVLLCFDAAVPLPACVCTYLQRARSKLAWTRPVRWPIVNDNRWPPYTLYLHTTTTTYTQSRSSAPCSTWSRTGTFFLSWGVSGIESDQTPRDHPYSSATPTSSTYTPGRRPRACAW